MQRQCYCYEVQKDLWRMLNDVSIPVNFYGFKITWAAFCFPLVIVTTDLTTRLLGKSFAQNIIGYSFPFAILSKF